MNDETYERAEAYILIGHLFKAPPAGEVLEMIGGYDGDDTSLGRAVADVAKAARTTPAHKIDDEFAALFIGITPRDEVSPYGSVHRSAPMFGEGLADLRNDLGALGIARREDVADPEDHISVLCEVMGGLLKRQFGRDASPEEIAGFFKKHLEPWVSGFARAVEETEGLDFYGPVGRFTRLFLEREAGLFH